MNAAASTNKQVGDVLSTAWKKDEFRPHSLINHAGFVEKRIESKSACGRQMINVSDETTSGEHMKSYCN